MTQNGTWVIYSGTARIALAVALLVIAAALAYLGTRLPLPVGLARRPGRKAAVSILVAWVLAIAAFLACFAVYARQAHRDHLLGSVPQDNVLPLTLLAATVTFFVVAISAQQAEQSGWTAFTSGVIAAMAGPMIFEIPFDVIVMARTYPPIAPDPALYRVVFFAPLFLIAFLTLLLLTLSPMVKLSRATFFSFAMMLAAWAVWALSTGFAYPSSPVSYTLNVVSKFLAFATIVTLFVRRPEPRSRGVAAA
jgi:hypothetical protein